MDASASQFHGRRRGNRRASDDQIARIRWGAVGSVIYPGRTLPPARKPARATAGRSSPEADERRRRELTSVELIEELVACCLSFAVAIRNGLPSYGWVLLRESRLPLEARSELIGRMTARRARLRANDINCVQEKCPPTFFNLEWKWKLDYALCGCCSRCYCHGQPSESPRNSPGRPPLPTPAQCSTIADACCIASSTNAASRPCSPSRNC